MRWEVTEQHLQNGYPHSCQFCPVALAAREALGIPVLVSQIEIRAGADRWFVDSILRDRIQAIDRGDRVRPFTVDLTGVMATVVGEDAAYAGS